MSPKKTSADEQLEKEVAKAKDLARRIQIGEFVRRELEFRSWTQGQLAEMVCCDQTTISKILRGANRTSDSLLGRLMEAFDLTADHLDMLPKPEFKAGSVGFRLKSLILGAHITHVFPEDNDTCARNYINLNWVNDEYRELPRTPNMEDAVWASLVAEGYFSLLEGLYKTNYQFQGDVRYFLMHYISEVCGAIFRLSGIEALEAAETVSQLLAALKQIEDSIRKPEQVADHIEHFNAALGRKDVLLQSILHGYSQGFRRFLVYATSVAGDTSQFDETLLPLMKALLEVLKQSVADFADDQEDYDWHESSHANINTIYEASKAWMNSIPNVVTIVDEQDDGEEDEGYSQSNQVVE